MTRADEMRRFWDERAGEDAFYFVDNELEYGSADTERFWAGGARALDGVLDAAGVEVQADDRVVEVGCGIGRITRALAGRAAHVDALDVSPRMLELAREHNPDLANVRWVLGDGESLAGIADRSADACFSHVVFQHLPDPTITLGYVREMGRVLADGGWAAFQISNAPAIHRRRALGERLGAALRATLRRGPRGQAHPAWLGSAVDLDDLRTAALTAGLDVERIAGAGTQFCTVALRRPPTAQA